MKIVHPKEEDIQNYVSNNTSNADLALHILHCESCRVKTEQYRQLFAGIHQAEAPVFEFNLTKLVMQKLPQAKPKFSLDNCFNHITVSVMIPTCSTAFYLFSTLLPKISLSVAPMVLYLIVTSTLSIVIALFLDSFKKHQGQMSIINFH